MAIESSPGSAPSPDLWQRSSRLFRGGLIMAMGGIAFAAPFVVGSPGLFLTGLLLIVCGSLEMLETFWSGDSSSTRWNYLSGEMSILAGILLLNKPELMLRAVALFLAVIFVMDGISKGVACWRARRTGAAWGGLLLIGVVKVALAVMLILRWPISDWPIVGVVVGIHMLTAGWSILLGRTHVSGAVAIGPDEHPDGLLQLPAHPALGVLKSTLDDEYRKRRASDARWCWVFMIVLFTIHLGRMRVDWNVVGMIDPLVALAGDLGMALLAAFCFIMPVWLGWRKLTRPLERSGWRRALARADAGRPPGLLDRVMQWWLMGRLRFADRLLRIRRSPREALAWGLRAGLPVAAVIVAINPLWGNNNYFFNTETWASGVWHRWAEARTDTWRENLIRAIQQHYADVPQDRLFRVEPPIVGDEDFSFIVIADNGDGGAAQHSLRHQYLALGNRPDVKFLVVSSDVIYPDGAMRDYEERFYLPFKGFTKPIYAIPGNHDWYDANEGFNANFLDAESARVCMQNRLETDSLWTARSQRRIDGFIAEAARLRGEFGVSTGHQKGPFFEIQTNQFALIAVDTGVLMTVDAAQWDWFKAALERSRGKFRMVVLGHPLYTGGNYQGDPNKLKGEWTPPLGTPFGADTEPITAVHKLLKEEKVEVVMAGDMHDFEHYKESYKADGKERTMYHFVNGGGGAYIVVGLPFDWPRHPDLPDWTYFPRKDAIIKKLDAQTPFWKMPLWLWVKHLSGWPFSGYILSAAFDHNKAPYFQSFVEVQVLNSKREVHFIPYGANGPLRWRELENFEAWMPSEKTPEDRASFIVKMPSE
ncbi:MAG TPA: metallophosphoesterase [Gemmatales bacterium]|nr:metallophosphoesterase [Gemmatales bacterium]